MYSNYDLGKFGEQLAKKYLRQKGYTILAENYRKSLGEIDLIVSFNDNIVFIEVKTRTSDRFGPPQAALIRNKINRIRKLALFYLEYDCLLPSRYYNKRFDVIAISIDNGKANIKHLKNVF